MYFTLGLPVFGLPVLLARVHSRDTHIKEQKGTIWMCRSVYMFLGKHN